MQCAAKTSSGGFHPTETPRRQLAPGLHDVPAADATTPARSTFYLAPLVPRFPKLTRPAPDARSSPVRLEESFP